MDMGDLRGLGTVPHSALRLRPAFSDFDAELRFDVPYVAVPDNKACECGAILRGEKRPEDCAIFGTVCTPEDPVGLVIRGDVAYVADWSSVEIFDIHVPKYEAGEVKFGGRDSYFYTAIEEDPTWSFKSPSDVAVKVLSWVVEYNIRMAVDNTAEHIYTLGIEEEV